MSFVLDALKLSEQRRSRFARRVYAHPPPARQDGGRRRWLALPAAAALFAGVFLTWRLFAPASQAPVPAPAGAADMPAAAEPGASAASPLRAAIDGLEEPGAVHSATPGGDPSASDGEEPPSSGVPVPVLAGADRSAPAAPPAGRADGRLLESAPPEWPALTLQMLFYSPDSNRGFVQINGRNYRVGERLDDGPEVLEIAPHGVILAHQGKKALLAMDR